MAYNRLPQTVLAGVALKQNPPPSIIQPAGIVPVTLDADIASDISLGVVQAGDGLSITPTGVLSVSASGALINVTLTGTDYTVLASDYYIGATNNNITITLPLGILGTVYYIKNQSIGSITVVGTSGETLDSSLFKTLNSGAAITCVFDGTNWSII